MHSCFTGFCHSVHNRPYGYWVTACYGSVVTHHTGRLSCLATAFSLVWIAIWPIRLKIKRKRKLRYFKNTNTNIANFVHYFFFSVCVCIMGKICYKTIYEQECIPVGCVPATHWPSRGGWCVPEKLFLGENKIEKKRKNNLETPPPKNWMEPPPKNWRHPPEKLETPPDQATPPCGQTHACKNITLAQLRCGR